MRATTRTTRCLGLIVVLFALLAISGASPALAGIEEEAARQIELAEEDLAAGNFERAAASAASALRLDPSKIEGLVVRGLALKELGRLEDAGALLRAYRDLRGTLPLDDRVEPALEAIDKALSKNDEPEEQPSDAPEEEEPPVVTGPVAVVYGPDDGDQAAEQAYAAARPFLGGEPATSILPLHTLLPRDDGIVVLGAEVIAPCDDAELEGTASEFLEAAEAAVVEVEPEAADEEADAAELRLACGAEGPTVEAAGRLLAVRAAARWIGAEPEVAGRLWHELFVLDPEHAVDASLSPAAQALQLDAKLRAAEEPAQAEVQVILPKGWDLQADGRTHTEGPIAAGRRIVRVAGPEDQAFGAVVAFERGATATVGTVAGLTAAAQEPKPDGAVLQWAAEHLDPQLPQGANAVLLVNLSAKPPIVRHYNGERFLVLTASSKTPGMQAQRADGAGAAVPRGASAALLGGGLAATAVGVIVAAVANRDGEGLAADMNDIGGYADSIDAYRAAQAQQRVGVGLAVGGGVVAAVGGVTFVIPQPKARGEVVAR